MESTAHITVNKGKNVLVVRSAPPAQYRKCLEWIAEKEIGNAIHIMVQADMLHLIDREKFEKVWVIQPGPISAAGIDPGINTAIRRSAIRLMILPCNNKSFGGYDNLLLLALRLGISEVLLWVSTSENKRFNRFELKKYFYLKRVKKINAPVKRLAGMVSLKFPLFIRDVFFLCILLVRIFVRLWTVRRTLKNADNILVLEPYGFGRTVHDPDIMRRYYKGRNNVFIFYVRQFINPLVGNIFPDIAVVPLPVMLRVKVAGWSYEFSLYSDRRLWLNRIHEYLRHHLKNFTTGTIIALDSLLDNVKEMNDLSQVLAEKELDKKGFKGPGFTWFGGWTKLLNSVNVGKAQLPEKIRQNIESRILKFTVLPESCRKKYCCLYLREKDVGRMNGINEISSSMRNGPPFEDYILAIKFIISRGYIVLVTGDQKLERWYGDEKCFERKLVCAEWLGLEPKLFSLFAGTSVDIWIGCPGGHTALPTINRIPALMLGVFPLGVGFPNAWIHYKNFFSSSGESIEIKTLFSDLAFNYKVDGLRIQHNSPEEILDAVTCFFEDLAEPANMEISDQFIQQLPDYNLLKHTGSHLSRAWLKKIPSYKIDTV